MLRRFYSTNRNRFSSRNGRENSSSVYGQTRCGQLYLSWYIKSGVKLVRFPNLLLEVAALRLLAERIQYCSWSHPVLKSDFSDNGYSYLSAAALHFLAPLYRQLCCFYQKGVIFSRFWSQTRLQSFRNGMVVFLIGWAFHICQQDLLHSSCTPPTKMFLLKVGLF